MTNLTEKFLNVEIDESKLYYFKQKMSEEIEIGSPFSLNMVRAIDGTYLDCFLIEEVLAEVPSYEQWQEKSEENTKLKEQINKCCLDAINRGTANTVKAIKEFGMPERIKELVEENTKLKELLKECRHELEGEFGIGAANLVEEIDEVLADNKIQANTVACNKIQEIEELC